MSETRAQAAAPSPLAPGAKPSAASAPAAPPAFRITRDAATWIVRPVAAECPWLEYASGSRSLRFRSDRVGCEIVKLGTQESVVIEMVRALQAELGSAWTQASLVSFGLNQYPELYERIAIAALKDARWNGRRGRPSKESESINACVVALGQEERHFVEVARIFRTLGYEARLSSVEKVFVGTANDTGFGEALRAAGATPADRVPYESMVGFRLTAAP